MMLPPRIRLVMPLFVLGALALPGRAAPVDPLAAVQRGVEEVCTEIYDRADSPQPLSQRLRPVLDRDFDFEAITRRAVGSGWRQFNPEQRKKTLELFSELILRSYADRFEPKDRPTMGYGRVVTLAEGRVEVPTTITYRGNTYAVAYRLQNKGEAWLVYDVIVEGVSLIANFRAQFDELLQKGGPANVIRALEENLAAVTKP